MRMPPILSPARGALRRFAVLCAAMICIESVDATTLIVTTTADNGPGSLRQALADANDGDTIQFDTALSGLIITLTSDVLVVDRNITINGPGPEALKVERAFNAANFSIFHVMPGHTVTMRGLTISQGVPPGGGIFNDRATLTLNNCTVSNNIGFGGVLGGGVASFGESATLTIVDSTVRDNFSAWGGGLYNDAGTLTIINSTVSGNWAPGVEIGAGGGIANGGTLEISNSIISGNSAGIGGGGITSGGGNGSLTISNSTVSGNHAGTNQETTGTGGGISTDAVVTITNCTISGNTASSTKTSGFGGGIASRASAIITISNSTISGNYAKAGAGGISSDGALTITNSTVSGNWSNGPTGGIGSGAKGMLEIGHTILNAGPSGSNLSGTSGTVMSHGHNMSSDNGGGFLTANGDQINSDPILGPLQDNSGPTFTHELLSNSPAINAGDPSFTSPPVYDQRGPGHDRVFAGRIDIGSFEVQSAPSPTPEPSPTATSTPTATGTPSPARVLNISTRLRVEIGDRVMIGGFIITGTAPKNVAIRGVGPSLATFGLSDVMADPTLELRGSDGGLVLQNDDWQDDTAQAGQLTALGLALQDPKESGMVAVLPLGTYTSLLAGKNQTNGIGLVEIYDADTVAAAQLVNISTRGFVQSGDNVMIGGFILGGRKGNTRVVLRGIGPSLSSSGLSSVLADPILQLHDSNGTLLVANDNWQDDQVSAAQLIANGLNPADPLESGIFINLLPGAFTAVLAGRDAGIGVGLVEVYDLQ